MLRFLLSSSLSTLSCSQFSLSLAVSTSPVRICLGPTSSRVPILLIPVHPTASLSSSAPTFLLLCLSPSPRAADATHPIQSLWPCLAAAEVSQHMHNEKNWVEPDRDRDFKFFQSHTKPKSFKLFPPSTSKRFQRILTTAPHWHTCTHTLHLNLYPLPRLLIAVCSPPIPCPCSSPVQRCPSSTCRTWRCWTTRPSSPARSSSRSRLIARRRASKEVRHPLSSFFGPARWC